MTGYKYSWTADEVKEYWFEIDIGAYFPRVEWWTLSQQIELCGEGYHIPTRTDWENIIKMFENNWNDESDFAEAFKIPFAWVRVSWSAAMLWVGKEWDLWTNSFSYTNFARSFRADDYFSDVGGSTVFVEWYPIRCFKDINSSNSDVVANLNSGDEMVDAYEFAYRNGITSIDNIANAKMDGNLTRIAMAKMLSQYAINVLWKSPDTSKVMNFRDVSFSLDKEYNYWVTLAYQLWIMWIWVNEFRPNDTVTRAEFGTALSRMLYSTSDGNPYYITHLNKLMKEWIITNDDPKLREKRWYVMLMLMRSAQ